MKPADWFFVVGMMLLAAGLRFVGIDFGQPDPQYATSDQAAHLIHENTPLHPDEFLFVQLPLRMLLLKQFNPKFFHNPSFVINLNLVTFWLTGSDQGLRWEDRNGLSQRVQAPFPFYVISRTYSALGGVVAVAAVYAATRRLAGNYAAAAAGMLTAVSFPMVQHAHYATPNSIAAGFTMMCVWASFNCLQDRRFHRWMFVLAGVGAGLVAGTRYNAAAVAIVVFLVGLLLLWRFRDGKAFRAVLIGWLLVPVSFTFTTPHVIFDPVFFLSEFRYITNQYIGGLDVLFTTHYGLWFEYRYLVLFGLGVPVAVAVVVGVWASLRSFFARGSKPLASDLRSPLKGLWLFVSILFVYLLAYSLVVLKTPRAALSDQLLVPVIPQFALVAGIGAEWGYKWLKKNLWVGAQGLAPLQVWIAPLLLVVLIVVPLVLSAQFVRQLAQPDTRQLMQVWIYHHLPHGSTVHLNGPYNVPLDAADYTWTQNYAADLVSLDKLRAEGVDYMILSDAWYYDTLRSGEIVPEEYRQDLRDYLATFDDGAVKIVWIDRPIWTGYDWVMHTASYWHNPGLAVYCLSEESCSAVR